MNSLIVTGANEYVGGNIGGTDVGRGFNAVLPQNWKTNLSDPSKGGRYKIGLVLIIILIITLVLTVFSAIFTAVAKGEKATGVISYVFWTIILNSIFGYVIYYFTMGHHYREMDKRHQIEAEYRASQTSQPPSSLNPQ